MDGARTRVSEATYSMIDHNREEKVQLRNCQSGTARPSQKELLTMRIGWVLCGVKIFDAFAQASKTTRIGHIAGESEVLKVLEATFRVT